MCPRPPSPYRAGSDSVAFNLGSHLRRVFECVGFEPTELSKVGDAGSYHGQSRRGGTTFAFAVELFARDVMQKFDDEKSESGTAKQKVANDRFDLAEQLCSEANERFNRYFYGHRPADEQVSAVLIRAREKIGNLFKQVDWQRVESACTFTSGSSVLLAKGRSTAIHKYSAKVESTKSALSIVSSIFSKIPALSGGIADESAISIVAGNKLTCVPKNYKSHRMIASEPSGQMYVQKGLHSELRRLLKLVGVDLSDQTQNQDWALLGSKTGLVATVDMSMASDTVAYAVVEWLYSLVPEVFVALDSCRSTQGELTGQTVTYDKFSSMGNATTFEIESSIFWALATSVCDILKASSRFVGVYGDDVVLPNRCVDLFFRVLAECGFVPNRDKTFYEETPHPLQHRFRESCGKQYFRGEDVTPVYIRKQPRTRLDYFLLVNNLVRWLRRLEELTDAPCLDQAWSYVKELRELAPDGWKRPRIPDGFGDGAFIGTFDECMPSTYKGRKSRWIEGYRVEVLTTRSDNAVGRSACGYPLIRVVGGKKGSQASLKPLERNNLKKYVEPVTARGFALASLEKLERNSVRHELRRILVDCDLTVREYESLTRITPRELALSLAGCDLPNEGMSVELPQTSQVSLTTLTIPRSVSW